MADGVNAELVEAGDLDELTRHIDRLSAAGDWDGLVDLRDRCRRALERGRQLWPAASLAEYRLALDGPGRFAASVLEPGAGRFSLGPLSEVAASTHTWAEMAPFITPSPATSRLAHERAVRGERLADDPVARLFDDLQIPLALLSFEPAYATAEYRADGVTVEEPADPAAPWRPIMPVATQSRPHPAVAALREPVDAWSTESEGRVRVVAVRGDVEDALGALRVTSPAQARALTTAEAMALMAAAGATAGLHGRRRGAAQGRFAAWVALTGLVGLEWPPEPSRLEDALDTVDFFEWDDGSLPPWRLRVGARVADSWTVAVDATDA